MITIPMSNHLTCLQDLKGLKEEGERPQWNPSLVPRFCTILQAQLDNLSGLEDENSVKQRNDTVEALAEAESMMEHQYYRHPQLFDSVKSDFCELVDETLAKLDTKKHVSTSLESQR
jgi:hypothetical protein